jgi:hypothetical protein
VQPWANVELDKVVIGMTPIAGFEVAPGPHSVVLSHPSYQPYPLVFRVAPGEKATLRVDLRQLGVPLKP